MHIALASPIHLPAHRILTRAFFRFFFVSIALVFSDLSLVFSVFFDFDRSWHIFLLDIFMLKCGGRKLWENLPIFLKMGNFILYIQT